MEPGDTLDHWLKWENELSEMTLVKLQRCHTPTRFDVNPSSRQLHNFCDASERMYGAVAYLQTEYSDGSIYAEYVLSRSRVAPKRHTTLPRLELSAALSGAHMGDLLANELTLPISDMTF